MSSVFNQCGFVYLVYGQRFLDEAVASATQLRRYHDEPICLITDSEPSDSSRSAFDEIKILPMQHDYRDKLLMRLSPYERTIFLDSDTIVVANLGELFLILDHFDIGVQFTEGGNHYQLEGVPPVFREPSAGIIVWKKNPITETFFDAWNLSYDRIQHEQGQPGAWDQRSLRKALYESDARILAIPTEFQFYTYRPNIVAGKVHMIHGRNLTSAQIKQISEPVVFRIWIPKVGWSPVPSHARPSQLIHLSILLAVRSSLMVLRRILAWSRIIPYPVNRRPA